MTKKDLEFLLDRETADCYLTILETVAPEDAARMEAAYEHLQPCDADEWAGLMIDLLEENGLEV